MENLNNINQKKNTAQQLPLRGSGGFGLKICGMKYPDNILAVSKLLPDFLGFIFWEKSSRFFEGEIPEIPKSIKKTGVFVDASFDFISEKILKYDLKCIQLHGKESVNFLKKLQSLSVEIIKVFSVNDDFDFEVLKEFEPVCDYFLFDTKGKLPGGNGVTFNWEILTKYKSEKPLFLSGGIGIEEISNIKNLNLPIFAIDVNSKFEIEPGLKNIELLTTLQQKLKL